MLSRARRLFAGCSGRDFAVASLFQPGRIAPREAEGCRDRRACGVVGEVSLDESDRRESRGQLNRSSNAANFFIVRKRGWCRRPTSASPHAQNSGDSRR